MPFLIEQIHNDIVAAMYAKDSARLTALRAIKVKLDSATREKTDKNGEALQPVDEQKALESMVKQRMDSIEAFAKGARADLIAIEESELAIIKSYMPQDATHEEIEEAITHAMRQTMDLGSKAIGTIMKHVKSTLVEKRVDGKILSEKIKSRFITPSA